VARSVADPRAAGPAGASSAAGRRWLLVFLPALTGCGYTLGYRMPPGVRTVSIPIFENATFPLRREVEFEITSAFRQELQARTDLRIVDENGSPDLLVRGRILEFRERVIAQSRQDVKTESNLVALVELRIENYLAGTVRVERVNDVEPFSIESGESFATGQRRAIRNIAEKLVVAMEDWGGDGEAAPAEGSTLPSAATGVPTDGPPPGAERGGGGGGAPGSGAAPAGGPGATIHLRRGRDGLGSSRPMESI
jgi:lipopolysaccharide assembly LptE-like protein